jgi:type II secretory pathway predicted ATPase ExeA
LTGFFSRGPAMYETFFGLTRRPFTAAPQVDRYVPNQYSEQALATLSRSIERGEGPGLIIGATGTGKTLLLHKLAHSFTKKYRIAYLATARFSSPSALLQNILYELGRPYRGMKESELRLALTEYLLEHDADERPLLLLVDEAHTLSLRLLEEFRMVTNLVRRGQALVRLILAGNARLEERFTSPKLDSLNQRIAARCYLESLNREDTRYYVRQQIARAGGNPDATLAEDAYAAIYTATDGVPRLLNQVCDQALLLAAVAEHRPLDAACVEEAWADLQQLPTPWNREPMARQTPAGESSGVLEFGSLGGEEPDAADDELLMPAVSAREAAPRELSVPAEAPRGEAVFSYDTHSSGDPTLDLEQLQHSLSQLGEEVQQATLTGSLPASQTEESYSLSQMEEEEFQPAGFVGPEVELVFHGPHHPFGETFAEEEVVIDHYASLEKTTSERRVHDQSGQGKEIASVLERLSREPAHKLATGTPALAIVADEHAEHVPHCDPSPVVRPPLTDLPALSAEWEAAADEPILPDYRDDLPLAAGAGSYQGELLRSADDRDIIIIEEDRGGSTAVATKPATRVRRQEYRQLFARLRRGE